MKKNLLRTFEAWSPEYISKSGSVSRSQALFVLAWFHAVVQERRIFIPQVHGSLFVWHVMLFDMKQCMFGVVNIIVLLCMCGMVVTTLDS